MLNTTVFKNKKVLLTGHTGFKGAWLTVWLHSLGAEILGYSLAPNTEPNLWNLLSQKSSGNRNAVHSIIADIRDKEKIKKTILDFQPDFVFHLAAQAIVRESYNAPIETFDTNIMGTANVLDALRFLEKPCIAVMITTDKVYKNNETGQAYKENAHFGGYDPYSASKAAAEIVIDSYRNSFFNPADYGTKHHIAVASARAGNVIGGGDWAKDRLVPDIVRALSKNEEVIIRNPNAVRPWQHVLEPLSGYLTLAEKMAECNTKYATAFNFGPNPDDTLTVKQMAEMAVEIWGNSGKIQYPNLENQPHEANLLSLSIKKAETELKWKPKWNAETALKNTINWYKNEQNRNVYDLCLEQIKKYQEN
ncbi:MAG: CDP-glucose 4,6-dehydratase [Bacteroidales bacterium]|jgi:CDP-glucose 4,6-dehydratase|nr:CDP-glucose 4,6-dehydratase [Bacteroidales bacterium]